MKKSLTVLFLLASCLVSSNVFAQVQDPSQDLIAQCEANPETGLRARLTISVGWAHYGLGDIIEQVANANPNVDVQEVWSYGLTQRTVQLSLHGNCMDTIRAYRMFSSISVGK